MFLFPLSFSNQETLARQKASIWRATSDFNGDGFADLATGVPGDRSPVSGKRGGTAHVLFGATGALSLAGNQFWHQDSPGVEDFPLSGDGFGLAFAPADFNGDGFADLAIGVPFEHFVQGGPPMGAVNVLYGTSSGLTGAGSQFWHQDSPGIADQAEKMDRFGQTLAAGDFNGDGYADLVIGAPGEDLGVAGDTGVVHVLYGSPGGLTADGSQFWHQDTPGIPDEVEGNEGFGFALGAADFNGDGFADLAIGAPGENIVAGVVHVLYGSPAGLTSRGTQLWDQDSRGVKDTAEPGDGFGATLAGGDFNGDGFADLAIGSFEGVGSANAAGAVNVLYGSSQGLTARGDQFWYQDSPGIHDTAESNDQFGRSLATGDFNGDGFDDLAVGVPGEAFGVNTSEAGAVHVLYGSATGLSAAGSQFWHQDSPGIPDQVEGSDNFGRALAAADFNKDGAADLAISAPSESLGDICCAGVVHVVYGSLSGGLSAAGNQYLHQDVPGIPGKAAAGDSLGFALGAW